MPPAANAPTATSSGFELYDADTDPRAIADNQRVEAGLTALAKTPASTPETPANKAPRHSPVLALRAKAAGFTSEDIETLTEAELKELLVETSLAKLDARSTTPQDPEAGSADAGSGGEDLEPAAAPIAQVAAAPPADPKIELVKKLKEAVDEDVADAIVGYIDAVLSPVADRVGRVEGDVKVVLPFVKRKHAEEADNAIDQGFEDLGPAFERVFGKGGARSIDHKASAFRRRVLVVNAVRANPPKDGNIRKAIADQAKLQFGDLVGEVDTAPPKRPPQPKDGAGRFTAADYEEAALVTPNTRTNPQKPLGREKAIGTIREIQAKAGDDSGDDINRGEDKFL